MSVCDNLTLTKSIPVAGDFDTVVCGGGPAGWVAAVSAARSGQRTALVERYGFLGGAATGCFVVPISGFFFRGERVVGGIAWELVERLEAIGGALVELPKGNISLNVEKYKLVAEQMAQESGVTLFTNSYLTDCVREGDRVTHIVIAGKSQSEALRAKTFIDATGDGDLCAMAGLPMMAQAQALQPISLCFVLGNVDASTELLRDYIHHDGKKGGSCAKPIRELLLKKSEEGKLPQFGGPWFNTLLVGDHFAVNITRAQADATDRAAFAEAERQLRRDMFALVECLKREFVEFQNAEVITSGINAGVRESRHIVGKYTLTAADMQGGKRFACPVAHCAHPIDIHAAKGAGQRLASLEEHCYVPYEAMVSESCANLIAAGRCISAEREPFASLRVQATLMSVGESAGVIAALSNESGQAVFDLPTDILAQRIQARGCVL